MSDILFNALGLSVGIVLLAVSVGTLKFLKLRGEVDRTVRGQQSGAYIEHGMTVDQETGEAIPEKKPARQAFVDFS
jgi:hypothetical protein